ncbi:acyltransferase family protein [Demequina aurantiaca]|uniref:acyltransferase family protein n=1 Tax=Demequina aurantiaca TaxID=676200 RepID=UPI003D3399FA
MRADIEGLRAVAVGLVLLFHAGISFVPAGFVGVDVFFVISGFLITGMLLREVARTGRISISRFYARRVKRLLPAATVVLATTAGLVWAFAPPLERSVFGRDISWSAVSLVNWEFASRAVDYQAEGIGASPVQQFWSLAVEEQFYLLWPILLILVGLAVKRTHRRLVPLATVGLLAITVPSFVWSVVLSTDEPARAFFVTTTRLWELGIGALIAVGASLWLRLPKAASRVLGWVGLLAIASSAVLLDETSIWPGWQALWPTLGAALVIVAGSRSAADSPALLRWRPAVWVGGISYSIYLWHWPVLVTAGWIWGELGQKQGLLLVALSFIPAWISYRFIENPIRRAKRFAGRPKVVLSIGLNLVAIGAIAGLLVGDVASAAPEESDVGKVTGASALHFDGEDATGVVMPNGNSSYYPGLEESSTDRPNVTAECAVDEAATEPSPCQMGDPAAAGKLVLAGDSKAGQWSDAVYAATVGLGWQFLGATKSACGFSSGLRVDSNGRPYDACPEYNANLTELLLADAPDVVVVSQRHSTAFDESGELTTKAMTDALVEQWETLEEAGIDVVALLDNPSPVGLDEAFEGQVPACLAEHLGNPEACAFDRASGVKASGAPAFLAAAERVNSVDVIDMTDVLCNETMCPPVIGDVLVYRQGSHITNTYATSATDILTARLSAIVSSRVGG